MARHLALIISATAVLAACSGVSNSEIRQADEREFALGADADWVASCIQAETVGRNMVTPLPSGGAVEIAIGGTQMGVWKNYYLLRVAKVEPGSTVTLWDAGLPNFYSSDDMARIIQSCGRAP